jgi:hypothetical protein
VLLAALLAGLTRTPLLAVDEVVVRGVEGERAAEVRSIAGVDVGDAMVDVDLVEVRRRVMELPTVGSAAVERSWPRRVVVTVAPLRPLAVVAPAGDLSAGMAVSAGGRVMGPAASVTGADALPDLTVEGAPVGGWAPGDRVDGPLRDALVLFEQAPPGLVDEFRSGTLAVDGSLRFARPDGGVIEFGPPEDVPAKLLAASTMLRSDVDRDCLAVLDLREPSRPTISREPGCDLGPPTVTTSTTTTTTVPGGGR